MNKSSIFIDCSPLSVKIYSVNAQYIPIKFQPQNKTVYGPLETWKSIIIHLSFRKWVRVRDIWWSPSQIKLLRKQCEITQLAKQISKLQRLFLFIFHRYLTLSPPSLSLSRWSTKNLVYFYVANGHQSNPYLHTGALSVVAFDEITVSFTTNHPRAVTNCVDSFYYISILCFFSFSNWFLLNFTLSYKRWVLIFFDCKLTSHAT